MLSSSDIERIDGTARALLEDPGVRIEDEESQKSFWPPAPSPAPGPRLCVFPGPW